MQNVLTIDFKQPFAKRLSADPAMQTTFFLQNGIEYDAAGQACDKEQVSGHYAKVAAAAQKVADEALQAAKEAQEEVAAMMVETGVSKTAVKKAAVG